MIYSLSSRATDQRVKLNELDAQKIKLDNELEELESPEEVEGKSGYELKKKIKEVRTKSDQNDTMIEKTEDILDNFEVQCARYERELEDAMEYAIPLKVD